MLVSHMRLLAIFIAVVSFPAFLMGAEDESALPPDPPAEMRRESVLAFGFGYGNYWESFSEGADTVKTHRPSPGVDIRFYTIHDKNTVGFFVHAFCGFPNNVTVNGVRQEYWSSVQVGYLLGPLFRHKFNEKFSLFYGAGLGFSMSSAEYSRYETLTGKEEYFSRAVTNIGIGADVALRYAIGKIVSLLLGCTAAYDFWGSASVRTKPPNPALAASGRVKDFFMLGIRPYIAIGCRL